MLLTPFAADSTDEKNQELCKSIQRCLQKSHTKLSSAADAYDAVYAVKAAQKKKM